MKKLPFSLLGSLAVFLVPFSTFAAICSNSGTPKDFTGILCIFIDLITTAIPIVAGLALLFFFWGLAKFILKADDETAREEGKQVMKWGIVALFVMVSVWGIVAFLQEDLFRVSTRSVPLLPVNRP